MKEKYYTVKELESLAKERGVKLPSSTIYHGVQSGKIKSSTKRKGLSDVVVIPESELQWLLKT